MKQAGASIEGQLLLGVIADIKKYAAHLEEIAAEHGVEVLAQQINQAAGASGHIGSKWERATAYASALRARYELLPMLERLADKA